MNRLRFEFKNPPPRLLGIATSKVFFLGSSFLAQSNFARFAIHRKRFCPSFPQSFAQPTVVQGKEGRNMGTYNPYFQNNVPERICPYCGTSRPLDWFGKELKHEIRDKRTGRVLRTINYRKYVACWRCRGIKRIATLTDPTRLLGNDLIGSTNFQGVCSDDLIG